MRGRARFSFASLAMLAAALMIAAAASAVSATVFVYYPLQASLTYVEPPVVFQQGSNAGQPDLGTGNTIAVGLGPNSTSATITIHPTYQKTYYKDILRIVNTDTTTTYYVYIKVNTAATLPAGAELYLLINGTRVDLTATGIANTNPIVLGAGQLLVVDLVSVYPEGTTLPTLQVSLEIVYTQSATETPP